MWDYEGNLLSDEQFKYLSPKVVDFEGDKVQLEFEYESEIATTVN